jgi:hypothetical protein
MLLEALKRLWCELRGHPNYRYQTLHPVGEYGAKGPGRWEVWCPDCDKTWFEDGTYEP